MSTNLAEMLALRNGFQTKSFTVKFLVNCDCDYVNGCIEAAKKEVVDTFINMQSSRVQQESVAHTFTYTSTLGPASSSDAVFLVQCPKVVSHNTSMPQQQQPLPQSHLLNQRLSDLCAMSPSLLAERAPASIAEEMLKALYGTATPRGSEDVGKKKREPHKSAEDKENQHPSHLSHLLNATVKLADANIGNPDSVISPIPPHFPTLLSSNSPIGHPQATCHPSNLMAKFQHPADDDNDNCEDGNVKCEEEEDEEDLIDDISISPEKNDSDEDRSKQHEPSLLKNDFSRFKLGRRSDAQLGEQLDEQQQHRQEGDGEVREKSSLIPSPPAEPMDISNDSFERRVNRKVHVFVHREADSKTPERKSLSEAPVADPVGSSHKPVLKKSRLDAATAMATSEGCMTEDLDHSKKVAKQRGKDIPEAFDRVAIPYLLRSEKGLKGLNVYKEILQHYGPLLNAAYTPEALRSRYQHMGAKALKTNSKAEKLGLSLKDRQSLFAIFKPKGE